MQEEHKYSTVTLTSTEPMQLTLNQQLFKATVKGDKRSVESLIERGADTNATDDEGLTAFGLAIDNGHTAIVAFLIIKLGADADFTEEDGFKPIHLAAEKGHTGVIRLLLERGDYINARFEGTTALSSAVKHRHSETAKLLLARGADDTVLPPALRRAMYEEKEEERRKESEEKEADTTIGLKIFKKIKKGENLIQLETEHSMENLSDPYNLYTVVQDNSADEDDLDGIDYVNSRYQLYRDYEGRLESTGIDTSTVLLVLCLTSKGWHIGLQHVVNKKMGEAVDLFKMMERLAINGDNSEVLQTYRYAFSGGNLIPCGINLKAVQDLQYKTLECF